MNQSDAVAVNHIAALCIEGLDARNYLQSQFTQDITLLSTTQAIYGAVLTPQGKVVADARVIQVDDHTLWILHEQAVRSSLLRRMKMFALGHDVTIAALPITIEYHEGGSVPVFDQASLLATKTVDGAVFLAHADFMRGCWRIVTKTNTLSLTTEEPSRYAQRVFKGIPRFTVDWHAGDYPLNANLHEFKGISFDKGCYVGQEISSRMHWRNGVRHGLYHVSLSSFPADVPCDLATSATIGRLSSCVTWHDDKVYGIARLPITIMDNDSADRRQALHTVDGLTLTVLKKSTLEKF